MLHIEDSIVRVVKLSASRAEVWARSFGSPQALSSWFPERVEGEFRLGEPFFLVWGEHRCECRLLEFDPECALAYQWHPGEAVLLSGLPEEELTTVRFTLLDAADGGTEVHMVESGFNRITESRRAKCFESNFNGWDEELPKLSKSYES